MFVWGFAPSGSLPLSLASVECNVTSSSWSRVHAPNTADDSSDLLRNASGFVVIEEVDMYKEIFVPLEEEKLLDINYFVCVLVEYVRSLHLFRLPVHIYLQQFVIYVLVKNSRHHILHQFLQYHVIG